MAINKQDSILHSIYINAYETVRQMPAGLYNTAGLLVFFNNPHGP